MKLFESNVFEEIKDLDYLKNNEITDLMRGSRNEIESTKIAFKESRPPKDTWKPFHETVNRLAEEKVGYAVRNGMLATNDLEQTGIYGSNVYHVVPTNGFKVYYNPNVRDMTAHYDVFLGKIRDDIWNIFYYATGSGAKFNPLKDRIHTFVMDYDGDILGSIDEIEQRINVALQLLGQEALNLLETKKEEIMEQVREYFNSLNDTAIQYVNGIKSIDDISSETSFLGEFMVYAPNGIYLINSQDFD